MDDETNSAPVLLKGENALAEPESANPALEPQSTADDVGEGSDSSVNEMTAEKGPIQCAGDTLPSETGHTIDEEPVRDGNEVSLKPKEDVGTSVENGTACASMNLCPISQDSSLFKDDSMHDVGSLAANQCENDESSPPSANKSLETKTHSVPDVSAVGDSSCEVGCAQTESNQGDQDEAIMDGASHMSNELEVELTESQANVKALTEANHLLTRKLSHMEEEANTQSALLVELQSSLSNQLQQGGEVEYEKNALESKLKTAETALKIEREELRLARETFEKEQKHWFEEREQHIKVKQRSQQELSKVQTALDERASKEAAMISRLNESKKMEANKSREATAFKGELDELRVSYARTSKELKETTAERDKLSMTLEKLKAKCVERVKKSEEALDKELKLNEERKKKMKEFVQLKSEELRAAKNSTDAVTRELDELRITYKDVRERFERAEAIIVSKDEEIFALNEKLEKMKENSDHLHKLGDTLESKLSRTAKETEEHKQRRLTAKHELMTVLRTLEAERQVSKELRESIKFTFTPKALSQQQLLRESVESLEIALLRLSRRLGKTLPPVPGDKEANSSHDASIGVNDEKGVATSNGGSEDLNGSTPSILQRKSTSTKLQRGKAEWDSTRLLSNLETETKNVSQGIMTLISSLERLHSILEDQGDRTCVSSLADLLTGRHLVDQQSAEKEGSFRSPSRSKDEQKYGAVPNTAYN